MENVELRSQSSEQTEKIGYALGQILRSGDIVLLYGQPGAGKTTLTRGIARGLGYYEYVNSPTYTLVNEYQGEIPIYHMDLYRLEGNGLDDLGFEEYLYGEGVCIVEWPDGLEMDKVTIQVTMDEILGDARRIRIWLPGAEAERFRRVLNENSGR